MAGCFLLPLTVCLFYKILNPRLLLNEGIFLSLVKSVVFQVEISDIDFTRRFCNALPQPSHSKSSFQHLDLLCLCTNLHAQCIYNACSDRFPALKLQSFYSHVALFFSSRIFSLLTDFLCNDPLKIPQPIECLVEC